MNWEAVARTVAVSFLLLVAVAMIVVVLLFVFSPEMPPVWIWDKGD